MTDSLLLVGCGDIGRRIAAQHRAQNPHSKYYGVVSTPESAAELPVLGITPILADLDAQAALPELPEARVLFYCAPPPNHGLNDARLDYFLANFELSGIHTVVYLSTSGVYGDCGGAWIDETAPLLPKTPRAVRRLAAERAWQAHINHRMNHQNQAIKLIILRVPGIYGEGRMPRARLEQGLPLVRPEESSFTNRIHQDDLARVALIAAQNGKHNEAYNVSDGQPSTMYDYHVACANILGLPVPPMIGLAEAKQQLSPSLLSYYEESKRLINHKILNELGAVLQYPSLHDGLRACF